MGDDNILNVDETGGPSAKDPDPASKPAATTGQTAAPKPWDQYTEMPAAPVVVEKPTTPAIVETRAPAAVKAAVPDWTASLLSEPKSDDLAVKSVSRKSAKGWRGVANKMGFSISRSADEVRFEQLWKQARQRIAGTWYVPVIGSGGVTTIAMALGSTFAELRGEKVLAIDADPGFGDLVDRAELERSDEFRHTLSDMLRDSQITTYSDCRAYTVMNVSDLEILAADTSPERPEFTGPQLDQLLTTIAGHYQLVFSDHGQNLRDSVGLAAFEKACALVIVCGTTLNDTNSVLRQIALLKAHGYHHLLERAVLVINQLHGHKPRISVKKLDKRFRQEFSHIQLIGFDEHLSEGGAIRTELISPPVRRSFVELAALTGSLIDSSSRGIR
ncbi:MAG: MinD/ParA family protein [Nocardiaceae bacterium]|nr:MinD/ParA family protein [Nocardiaceae bacterium]